MMRRELIISYVYSFISFLIRKLGEEFQKISRIILFGSVVTGDLEKDSDIDIFIETADRDLQEKIYKIEREFYRSKIFNEIWELFGIENQFSIIVGELEDFPDLKESIIVKSMTLYQYGVLERPEKLEFMFYWGKVSRDKRMKIKRFFEGYERGGKKYPPKVLTKRISTNCYIVQEKDFWKVFNFLRRLNIPFSFRRLL